MRANASIVRDNDHVWESGGYSTAGVQRRSLRLADRTLRTSILSGREYRVARLQFSVTAAVFTSRSATLSSLM